MMKIAFLFSGQGAQTPGMMKELADRFPAAREVFDIAGRTLNRDIYELCMQGTQEELNLTHNTQPCVLAADLAACAVVRSTGIEPDAVAGFSLGEYAALTASGAIAPEEIFPLIQKRADYMQEAVPQGEGAMAAVLRCSAEEVEALCRETEGFVVPANYNCPGQIVVSGEASAIDRLLQTGSERGIRMVKIAVSAPFHCDLMAPAAEKLEKVLDGIHIGQPNVPAFMNVDGLPETEPELIRRKLVLQAKSPVRWEETIRRLRDYSTDVFIELGPGSTLAGFVRKTLKGEPVQIFSVDNAAALEKVTQALQGEL
ncbi:MAG: ACP S-malonyltransferase [Clostridiales bacterium]|nr:ACP S-malonyltransferase [Clostridiales bacterium]